MIVCPVCEHAQAAATECEVCGRALGTASPAPLDVPRLEGVEATRFEPAPAVPGALAELEPTAHAPAASIDLPGAFDVTPLEPTRAAPVDVDAAPLADVEPTSQELPGDAPTALPAFAVCRYCRTPALPGERLCSRCGMRLPVVAAAPRAAAPDAVRLCSCGVPVRGRSCPACGARAPG